MRAGSRSTSVATLQIGVKVFMLLGAIVASRTAIIGSQQHLLWPADPSSMGGYDLSQ
jgi:hypothetical protein